MKQIIKNFVFCFSIAAVLFLVTGCPEKSTTRALVPSSCNSDSLRITATAIKSGPENNWRVEVKVNIKCGTVLLGNTELKLNYNGDDFIYMTNAAGDFSRKFGPATGNPTGVRVTVSVMGSDGNEAAISTLVQ